MIDRFWKRKVACFLLLLICFSGRAIADRQERPTPDTSVVRLTTHPALDVEPAISPDGRWVAFASNRSGNFDIWVKPLHGGVAYRITSHPADDRQPRWTHDGHGVLFVSQRSDPNGDIWRIDIRRRGDVAWSYGKPRCLTPRVCYDAQPDPHPKGKVAVFVSDRGGVAGIWLLKLGNRHTRLLRSEPALWPRWSPDGHWLAWIAPDSAGWSLRLAAFDAKHDSLMGPVVTVPLPEGQPVCFDWNPFGAHLACLVQPQTPPALLAPPSPANLWVVPAPDTVQAILPAKMAAGDTLPPRPYRLSYPANQFLQLAWRHGPYIVVAAGSDTTSELLRWPALGRIVKKPTSAEQLEHANRFAPIPTHLDRSAEPVPAVSHLWEALEALARVFDFHRSRSAVSARALYQYACAAWIAGDTLLASQSLQRLQHLPVVPEEISSAASLLQADLQAVRPGATLLAVSHASLDSSALSAYWRLFRNQGTHVRVRAFAAFRLGQLLEQKQPQAALALFDSLTPLFPLQEDLVLAAQLEKAKLQAERDSLARRHYLLRVLARAASYPELGNEAIEMLLNRDWFASSPSKKSLEAALQLLQLPGRSETSAYIGLWIASRALEMRAFSVVERALTQIAPFIPEDPNWKRRFIVLQSRLYLLTGKPGAAMKLLRHTPLDSLPASLVRAVFSSFADSLTQVGQTSRALQTYLEAWPYALRDPEFHRKLVHTAHSTQELNQIIVLYEQARKLHPRNPILDYALGLCYYHLATAPAEQSGSALDIDVKNLDRSLRSLQLALRKDSGLVPAYLALARDYETLETAQQARAQKKSAWMVRAARFILAPAFFVFRTVTLRKGEPKRRYYERAIDALTIALQINDERRNPKLEARLYESLAHNTYSLGEYSYRQALEYFRKRLAIDSTFESTSEELRFFQRMGHCAFSVRRYSLAAEAFAKALSAAEKLHRRNLVPSLLTELGTALSFAGKSTQARTVFERLLRLPRTLSNPYHRERAYRNLALAYLGAGEIDSTFAYSSKALEFLTSGAVPETKRPAVRLRVAFLGWTLPVPFLNLRRYGLVPAYEGTPDLTLAEEKALVLQIQADASFYRGDLGGTVRALSRKSAVLGKSGDHAAQSVAENNLAYVYLLADWPKQAWAHFVEAWKLAKKSSDLDRQIQNLEALIESFRLQLVLHPPATAQGVREVRNQAAFLEGLLRQTQKALAATRIALPPLELRFRLAAARLREATAKLLALAPRDSTVEVLKLFAVVDTLTALDQELSLLQTRVDSLALLELRTSTLATRAALSQWLGNARRSYTLLNQLRSIAESRKDTASAARQEIRMAVLLSQLPPRERVALRAGWDPERLARRGALRLLGQLLKRRWVGPADRKLLHTAVSVQVRSYLRHRNYRLALQTVRRFHSELASLLLAPLRPDDPAVERWWLAVYDELRVRAVRAATSLEENRTDTSAASEGNRYLDGLRRHNLWFYQLAQALLAVSLPKVPQPCTYEWHMFDKHVWLVCEGDSVRLRENPALNVRLDFSQQPGFWPDPLYASQSDTLHFAPTFPMVPVSPHARAYALRANRVQPLYSFLLTQAQIASPKLFPGPTLAITLFQSQLERTAKVLCPPTSPELVFLLQWLQATFQRNQLPR